MRSSLAMLAFLVGVSPLAADPVIQRGIDTFVTPDNGTTSYDFAQNPIPAGFFCKSSKTFTGRVTLKGLPLATGTPGQLGRTDTVIERLTFIPVKPARNKAARNLELTGSFTFPATPLPWRLASVGTKKAGPVVLDTDGDLAPDSVVPNTTNFFPGWSPDGGTQKWGGQDCPSCLEYTCHTDPSTGEEHCTYYLPPYCLEPLIC